VKKITTHRKHGVVLLIYGKEKLMSSCVGFMRDSFKRKGKICQYIQTTNKQTNKQTRLIPHFQERKEKKKLAND